MCGAKIGKYNTPSLHIVHPIPQGTSGDNGMQRMHKIHPIPYHSVPQETMRMHIIHPIPKDTSGDNHDAHNTCNKTAWDALRMHIIH